MAIVLVNLCKSVSLLLQNLKHKSGHEAADVDHLEPIIVRVVEAILRGSPYLRRGLALEDMFVDY